MELNNICIDANVVLWWETRLREQNSTRQVHALKSSFSWNPFKMWMFWVEKTLFITFNSHISKTPEDDLLRTDKFCSCTSITAKWLTDFIGEGERVIGGVACLLLGAQLADCHYSLKSQYSIWQLNTFANTPCRKSTHFWLVRK